MQLLLLLQPYSFENDNLKRLEAQIHVFGREATDHQSIEDDYSIKHALQNSSNIVNNKDLTNNNLDVCLM